MRHSSLDLTMNVYTDPELLDVAGALDALPQLDLEGEVVQQLRTGTKGEMVVTGPAGIESAPRSTPKSTRIVGSQCPSVASHVIGQPTSSSEGKSQLAKGREDRQLLSTLDNCRQEGSGAGDRIRTGDVQLGKLTA